MTLIRQEDFVQSIADAFQYISYYHPVDFIKAMVHCLPLPGTVHYHGNLERLFAQAVQDAKTLEAAGVDAVIVENMWEGWYVLVTFKSEGNVPKELERQMENNDKILRYLVIKLEEKKQSVKPRPARVMAPVASVEAVEAAPEAVATAEEAPAATPETPAE